MSPKCSHQKELRPKSSTALSNTREHGREGQKAVNKAADVREHSRGRLVVREHVRRRQDVPADAKRSVNLAVEVKKTEQGQGHPSTQPRLSGGL